MDTEDSPPEGIAITDFDELSLVEEYRYLGMEEAKQEMTLGESNLQLPFLDKDGPNGLSAEAQASLLEDVKAIRADISLFLYGVLPVVLAAIVLFKGCIWFYRTFIAGAFE